MTNRIMTMANDEMVHRHKWETSILNAKKADIKRASWLGFTVAIFSLMAACFCAYINQPAVAFIALLPPAGGVMLAIPRIVKSFLGDTQEN